jgi:hypothetical protein
MARKSLKPQLNQIRAWVRQGRTDAWIAHQLEVSTAELRDFRRQHDLSADQVEPGTGEIDLRDEIEAEVEAATEEEARRREAEEAAERARKAAEEAARDAEDDDDEEADGSEAEGRPRRRRRRGRRGGRGRGTLEFEATFDHGEQDGYGLWLDPAIQDDPVYSEHWAGHREVTVKIEADQIVITRAGEASSDED